MAPHKMSVTLPRVKNALQPIMQGQAHLTADNDSKGQEYYTQPKSFLSLFFQYLVDTKQKHVFVV